MVVGVGGYPFGPSLSFVSLLLFDKLGVLYVCWLLSTKFTVIYS